MTDDYIFRINGRGKPFGKSKLLRLADKLPNTQVTVIDTHVCKPIGSMSMGIVKKKFT